MSLCPIVELNPQSPTRHGLPQASRDRRLPTQNEAPIMTIRYTLAYTPNLINP